MVEISHEKDRRLTQERVYRTGYIVAILALVLVGVPFFALYFLKQAVDDIGPRKWNSTQRFEKTVHEPKPSFPPPKVTQRVKEFAEFEIINRITE